MRVNRDAANPQRDLVDLRSDTVTRPTAEMYEAMLRAPLGDDVLGDEPTVAELERLSAETLGKEAALFVPSGTMGNQIAILCQTERGDAILAEEDSHILHYECGGPGALAGVVTWTLPSELGTMDPRLVESRVVQRTLHSPGTVLLCVENTHNRAGGTVVSLDAMRAYRQIADRNEMRIHLDGARIFNAAVALGLPAAELCSEADSVSFCLSKGLGSPVGSLLCGSSEMIEKARQWRKRLGGGMRQSGLLAACGIVSLTQMVDRLAEDHARARDLANFLESVPGLSVDWARIQTNMVLVRTEGDAPRWIAELREEGILALALTPDSIRLVLHADVDNAKLKRAQEAFRDCAARIAA
jgi:threonine aldolase